MERCGHATLRTGRHGEELSHLCRAGSQGTVNSTPVQLPRLSLSSLLFPLHWSECTGGPVDFTMDPKEASNGSEKEKEKEKVVKRRNRPVFLRYLERRKTDTIVADDMAKGDINLGTLVRRSQSDKTEYSAKLKGTAVPRAQNYGNYLIPCEFSFQT